MYCILVPTRISPTSKKNRTQKNTACLEMKVDWGCCAVLASMHARLDRMHVLPAGRTFCAECNSGRIRDFPNSRMSQTKNAGFLCVFFLRKSFCIFSSNSACLPFRFIYDDDDHHYHESWWLYQQHSFDNWR